MLRLVGGPNFISLRHSVGWQWSLKIVSWASQPNASERQNLGHPPTLTLFTRLDKVSTHPGPLPIEWPNTNTKILAFPINCSSCHFVCNKYGHGVMHPTWWNFSPEDFWHFWCSTVIALYWSHSGSALYSSWGQLTFTCCLVPLWNAGALIFSTLHSWWIPDNLRQPCRLFVPSFHFHFAFGGPWIQDFCTAYYHFNWQTTRAYETTGPLQWLTKYPRWPAVQYQPSLTIKITTHNIGKS